MATNSHQQPIETKKPNRPGRKEGDSTESLPESDRGMVSNLTNMDVKGVVREAREFMEQPRQRVMDLVERSGVINWWRTADTSVTAFVRRRPYTAVLSALAIGALIFSRTRKVRKAS